MTIDRAAPRRAGAADFRTLSALLGRAFVDDPGWAWILPGARPPPPARDDVQLAPRGGPSTSRRRAVRRGPAGCRHLAALGEQGPRPARQLRDGRRHGPRRGQPAALRGVGPGARELPPTGAALVPGDARDRSRRTRVLAWHRASCATTSTTRPAAGEASYLEVLTEANLAFYARFGFEVCGEIDVPSDGPHVWQYVAGSLKGRMRSCASRNGSSCSTPRTWRSRAAFWARHARRHGHGG